MNIPTPNQSVQMNSTELDTDAELIMQLQAGDINAYEGIMRRHNLRLFRLARSIVNNDVKAMDVIQETYITAFRHLQELREPEALAAWLARIAKNEALMRLRKDHRSHNYG